MRFLEAIQRKIALNLQKIFKDFSIFQQKLQDYGQQICKNSNRSTDWFGGGGSSQIFVESLYLAHLGCRIFIWCLRSLCNAL
jgi:hypothetical protein